MILLLIAIIFGLFIYDYYIHKFSYGRLIGKIPGIKILPIFGNVIDFVSNGTPVKLFYSGRWMANEYRNKGNIARTWIFNQPIINMYDPDDIEVLLSNPKYINKGKTYNLIRPWLNDGLLTSTGEKWHNRRKILTPTFHFNILRNFCKTFIEHSNKLIELLKTETKNLETDIGPYITNFTLHTISETAMGINIDDSGSNSGSYKEAIYDLGKILVHKFCRFWLNIDFIFNLTNVGKEHNNALKILHDFTINVIKERKKKLKIEDDILNSDDSFEDLGIKKRMAMLDLLLKAEVDGLIDEIGIREEVDTFAFEGHDTISVALTFCLMLLANHPDVQDKILDEINDILDGSMRNPTIEDLQKMNYLEMVIKESLRLYPSVPFISRELLEDMQLKNYLVPTGTIIYLHIFDVHRNPNLFKNPDKFDPERFSVENSKDRHPYSYIPFSAGPRNCIGQKFAMLEAKAVLSTIVKNFILKPVTRPEDVIFICDIILRSKDPVKIKFIPRK